MKLSSFFLLLPLAAILISGCDEEDEPSACKAPTAVASNTVTNSGAVISFIPGAGNTTYTVTATPPVGNPVTATGTGSPITLTGLNGGTSYSVVVAGSCATAAPYTFTTTGSPTGSFSLNMEPRVGADALTLGTQSYTKSDGQTFKVTKFKYLLSNLRLLKADGSAYAVPESYYLVDANAPASSLITITNVPFGEYTGLDFIVGVDAARNSAGAQTGALDPGNDMFWNWNQGYIFMKMEGYSSQSPTTGLVFHIGENTTRRTITPAMNGGKIVVSNGHTPEVHLKVDVMSMFESTDPAKRINFITTPGLMNGGVIAQNMADNYQAGMFSIGHIHAN